MKAASMLVGQHAPAPTTTQSTTASGLLLVEAGVAESEEHRLLVKMLLLLAVMEAVCRMCSKGQAVLASSFVSMRVVRVWRCRSWERTFVRGATRDRLPSSWVGAGC